MSGLGNLWHNIITGEAWFVCPDCGGKIHEGEECCGHRVETAAQMGERLGAEMARRKEKAVMNALGLS